MATRLTAQQNADFDVVLTYTDANGTPINLTGYTAAMQVRLTYPETTAVVSLTNGSGITIGGVAGTLTIHIPAATTATLQAPKIYVYDVRIVSSGGAVYRILEGDFYVTPAVTR